MNKTELISSLCHQPLPGSCSQCHKKIPSFNQRLVRVCVAPLHIDSAKTPEDIQLCHIACLQRSKTSESPTPLESLNKKSLSLEEHRLLAIADAFNHFRRKDLSTLLNIGPIPKEHHFAMLNASIKRKDVESFNILLKAASLSETFYSFLMHRLVQLHAIDCFQLLFDVKQPSAKLARACLQEIPWDSPCDLQIAEKLLEVTPPMTQEDYLQAFVKALNHGNPTLIQSIKSWGKLSEEDLHSLKMTTTNPESFAKTFPEYSANLDAEVEEKCELPDAFAQAMESNELSRFSFLCEKTRLSHKQYFELAKRVLEKKLLSFLPSLLPLISEVDRECLLNTVDWKDPTQVSIGLEMLQFRPLLSEKARLDIVRKALISNIDINILTIPVTSEHDEPSDEAVVTTPTSPRGSPVNNEEAAASSLSLNPASQEIQSVHIDFTKENPFTAMGCSLDTFYQLLNAADLSEESLVNLGILIVVKANKDFFEQLLKFVDLSREAQLLYLSKMLSLYRTPGYSHIMEKLLQMGPLSALPEDLLANLIQDWLLQDMLQENSVGSTLLLPILWQAKQEGFVFTQQNYSDAIFDVAISQGLDWIVFKLLRLWPPSEEEKLSALRTANTIMLTLLSKKKEFELDHDRSVEERIGYGYRCFLEAERYAHCILEIEKTLPERLWVSNKL